MGCQKKFVLFTYTYSTSIVSSLKLFVPCIMIIITHIRRKNHTADTKLHIMQNLILLDRKLCIKPYTVQTVIHPQIVFSNMSVSHTS